MKLAIHEISSAMRAMRADDLQPAFKMLTRVARIFEQLKRGLGRAAHHDAVGIYELSRRSRQVVRLPVLAVPGRRVPGRQSQPRHAEAARARGGNASPGLEAILAEPSLYDEAILLLGRNGFDIGADGERDDWRASRTENDAVTEAWRSIYASPREHWMLYDLAEKAGRLRGLLPPLALQPRHDGRAHHRVEARHRRHSRRLLSPAHA